MIQNGISRFKLILSREDKADLDSVKSIRFYTKLTGAADNIQTTKKEMKINFIRIFYKRLIKIAVETGIKSLTKAVK